MGRAQDREPVDFSPVHHLANYQAGFYRLADAHVVRVEEPDRVLAQRHHQRRQLIDARREVQAPRAPERPGPPAQRKLERIPEELRRLASAGPGSIGRAEGCVNDGLRFDLREDRLDLGFGTRKRAEGKC